MEFIKKIEITNYKSIKHLVIDDCKKINLFIGYPNVGKSNILEALSLSSYHTNTENINKLCRYQTIFNLFHVGNIVEPIKIELNDELNFQLLLKNKTEYQVRFSINGKEINSPTDDNFQIDYGNIKKYQFISKHPNNIDSHESFLSIPYGENLFTMFQISPQLRKEAASIFELYDFKLNVDIEKGELRLLRSITENTIFTIPYDLSADTIQRVLFYDAAILTNEKSVLLFEEPEAHLFPPYIKKITTEIIFDERNNQYFINTHSPYVLNNFLEEDRENIAVYIVYYKEETKVKRLNEDELKSVLEYDIDLFYNMESFIK